MPENNLLTGAEALALVRRHLPRMLAANGRQFTDWHRARLLSGIARQQLRRHYGSGPAAPEAEMVLLTLTRLDTRLQNPANEQNWPFAQMQLSRIMPLVQRLLVT